MGFPKLKLNENTHLAISRFKEMDLATMENFDLPIELMMENAGLQLARFITTVAKRPDKIIIGAGNGNNGGGGLVAARRLQSWGFSIKLNLINKNLKPLTIKQLNRATAFGAQITNNTDCDVFVDAFLGFSQRLPLPLSLSEKLKSINSSNALSISLDLPSGFDAKSGKTELSPGFILTMAAMKTELIPLMDNTEIYIADIGIPAKIYLEFGIEYPAQFIESGIVLVER